MEGMLRRRAIAESAGERVESASPDRDGTEPVRLSGFWFQAAVEGPRPAVVLLHGCGGPCARKGGRLSARMLEHSARLNSRGVHMLVTDSLTPRGERELCTQRIGNRRVPDHLRRDALGALQ